MKLIWDCEICNHKWLENPIYTFEECPNCKSEDIWHGELIYEECPNCKTEMEMVKDTIDSLGQKREMILCRICSYGWYLE